MVHARVRLPGTLNRARRVPGNNTKTTMENLHVLRVSYNAASWSITITSDRFGQRIVIPKDFAMSRHIAEQAAKHLASIGYNILGTAEGKDHDYVITDTFTALKK